MLLTDNRSTGYSVQNCSCSARRNNWKWFLTCAVTRLPRFALPHSPLLDCGGSDIPHAGLNPRIVGESWGNYGGMRKINPLFTYHFCPYYRGGSPAIQLALTNRPCIDLLYHRTATHGSHGNQPSSIPPRGAPSCLPYVEAYYASPRTIFIRRIHHGDSTPSHSHQPLTALG